VNPAGAQNVSGSNEQIGIFYPTPSITSNAQQPNTSTTVGIKGYVQNNSNPGHVVAQVAYADAAGDCKTPGTVVYTTPQVSLQNPQTLITGSITGLYADVAYCWRLIATVTSGAQAGTYYGNWEYFITNGTYHTYANEPPQANPPAAGTNCSSSGSGCATSNCTSANCTTSVSPSAAGQQLTVALVGTGTGSVSDGKYISCPSTCSATYLKGVKVTLTPSAGSGSTFTGFSGGGCSGTGPCTVAMTAAQTVTATFSANQSGASGQSGGPGGNVTSSSTLLQSISLVRNQSLRSVLKRGLSFLLSCGSACQATIRLYLAAATAKKLHLAVDARASAHKKSPVLVGTATTTLGAAGSKTIVIKLAGKTARALAHVKSVRLTVSIAVTGTGSARATKTFTVRLAR
jgi:hypothetical protein